MRNPPQKQKQPTKLPYPANDMQALVDECLTDAAYGMTRLRRFFTGHEKNPEAVMRLQVLIDQLQTANRNLEWPDTRSSNEWGKPPAI